MITTAAYTICKNEINKINKWYQYASMFDYMVVLDTGSEDGTYEFLLEKSKNDPKFIVEQKIFFPFDYSEARNYNLNMVPLDVDWCLSPDIDEWFSINAIDEIQRIALDNPGVTNIATTRLDVYSKDVFIGPPHFIPTNKIHKRYGYHWKQPIYEHLWPNDLSTHKEIYSDKIFLIHDQDTQKPRNSMYSSIMMRRYLEDETDCWNNWYLLNHFYREKDILSYVQVAISFLKYSKDRDANYNLVHEDIRNLYLSKDYKDVLDEYQTEMEEVLNDIDKR